VIEKIETFFHEINAFFNWQENYIFQLSNSTIAGALTHQIA
jgi:hypothetical protein